MSNSETALRARPSWPPADMTGALQGKVALITGGASGIGRATATLFARDGAAVAVVDRNEAGGQTVVDAIAREGGRALFERADLTRAADCRHVVERTARELGGLHILFNNAGIIRRATVLELSEADWDQVMSVNVKSVFLLCKYAVPLMRHAGGGSIINTASAWGLVGGSKAAAYCASKGAVVLLTKAMAIDHGGDNIRVNCICPGDTDTPMLRDEAQQLGEPGDRFLGGPAGGNRSSSALPGERRIVLRYRDFIGCGRRRVGRVRASWCFEVWLSPHLLTI
jgi:NAD(P)-dependent dehydrogenase (short-subunit alcohol dehydrogenase family)